MGALLLAMLACGSSTREAVVVAERGGAALWPPNSRTAVLGAMDLGLPAITLDVVLTADNVAVLFDGPFLTHQTCLRSSGATLPEPVDLRRLRAETLAKAYRCGGLPHSAFPNALVVDEPVLTLAEMVHDLHDAPGALEIRLRVDAAAGPPLQVAKATLETWFAEDIPQDLVIASPDPVVLDAFLGQMRILGVDVPMHLVLSQANAVAGVIEGWAGGNDWTAQAEVAGAVGLWVPVAMADQGQIRAAQAAGLAVDLFTVDDPARIVHWATRVESVTTNYPGEAP